MLRNYNKLIEKDSSKADSLNAQKAQSGIAGTQSDLLVIKAPYNGVVADLNVLQGDIAMPGKPDDLSEIYRIKDEYGLGASVDRLIAALGW